MLNCTIYALIYIITLGFTYFDSVCRFSLCKPSYVSRIKILRPCGSQKMAKKAKRYTTWTKHGHYGLTVMGAMVDL